MARISKINIDRNIERSITSDNSIIKQAIQFTPDQLASDKIQSPIIGDIEAAYYGSSTVQPVPAQPSLVNAYNEFTPKPINSRRIPILWKESLSDESVSNLQSEIATKLADSIIERATNRWLYDILPTDSNYIVATAGTTTRPCSLKSTANPAAVKAMTEANLRSALYKLDSAGFAVNDETIGLLSPEFKWDLFEFANFTQAERMNVDTALRTGNVWNFMGINFMMRNCFSLGSNGTVLTSANARKFVKENTYDETGTAFASTDVSALLLFKKSAVKFGLGLTRTLSEAPTGVEGTLLLEAAAYYAGGKARSDGKGIVAIIEAR